MRAEGNDKTMKPKDGQVPAAPTADCKAFKDCIVLQDASRMKVRKDGQAGDAQIANCEALNPVQTCFFCSFGSFRLKEVPLKMMENRLAKAISQLNLLGHDACLNLWHR